MSNQIRAGISLLCISFIISLVPEISMSQDQRSHTDKTVKENKSSMTMKASGTFEVKMTPQTDDKSAIGRYSLDKQLEGDLVGTSKGEMLAVGTAIDGSAGYVAMEKVTATLNGRKGTFALQHLGIMTRGAPQLTITVVPDSGTEELVGLSGKMDIKITEGKHFYSFEYSINPAP